MSLHVVPIALSRPPERPLLRLALGVVHQIEANKPTEASKGTLLVLTHQIQGAVVVTGFSSIQSHVTLKRYCSPACFEPTDLAIIESMSELDLVLGAVLVLEDERHFGFGGDLFDTDQVHEVGRLNFVVVCGILEVEGELCRAR